MRRLELLRTVFTPTGSYLDNHTPAAFLGPAEISRLMATFQSRLPHRLERVGEVHAHHHVFKWAWRLVHDGRELVSGIFTGQVNEEGLIVAMVGFLDN